jgi:hypothetical protein
MPLADRSSLNQYPVSPDRLIVDSPLSFQSILFDNLFILEKCGDDTQKYSSIFHQSSMGNIPSCAAYFQRLPPVGKVYSSEITDTDTLA